MRYGRAPGAQAHWRRFERPKLPHIRRTERRRRPAQTASRTRSPSQGSQLPFRNGMETRCGSAFDKDSGACCMLLSPQVHALTSSS